MEDYKHLSIPRNRSMRPVIELLLWWCFAVLFGVLLVYWYSPATVDAWVLS